MKKDRYGQLRSRWDSEARKESEIERKYGFKPFFGFASVPILGLIAIAGLVLTYFFSWKFLIIYGIALLLMIFVFWGHSVPKNGSSSVCDRAKNGLLKRSYYITVFGVIQVIIAFLISEYIEEYLAIVMLIGGIIIMITLYLIRKFVISNY